jgi:hypothetical protein
MVSRHGVPVTVRRLQIACVLVLFALIFSLLQWFSYRQKSATWDEPIHLAAGYAALAKGDYRFESTHPPFMRMWAALPLLFMDDVRLDTTVIDRTPPRAWHSGGTAFTHATKFLYIDNDANRLLTAARFMIVLCGIGLGVLIFAWAYEWFGLVAATFATAFYTISPTVLANTSLVTTDAGITCFIFGTVYLLWRTTQRYSVANVAGFIGFFMLAIVTKFSGLILGPLIVVLLAVAAAARTCITWRRAATLVPALAAAAVLAVWAVYGFRYEPSGSTGWVVSLETAPLAQTVPELARLTAWIDRHQLLPNMFTEGFLMFAQSMIPVGEFFLFGDYSTSGWWYYFPAAFLIKTPVGSLVLIAIGVVACLRRRRELGRLNASFLFVPIATYLAAAMNNPFQIGIRHILPIYPFLLVVTAAGVRMLVQTRPGRLALAAPVAMWVMTLANVYPHTLTFFNRLVGGPRHGSEYLADSNVDWGQGLPALKSWMTRRDVHQVDFAYFGSADPKYYGINYTALPAATPGFRLPDAPELWSRPTLPGYVAISATVLTGVYLDPQWRLFYSGLRRLPPADVIGNSIFVYWLDRWPDADYAAYPDLGSGDADWLLGNELLKVQWFRRAIVHYQRALVRHPDQPAVLQNLGAAMLANGDAASAIPPLERAVTLRPENGPAHLLLATALFDVRAGPDRVIPHARRSVALLPTNMDALLLLARALGVRGDLAEGWAVISHALALHPTDVEAIELMATFRKVIATENR